MDEIKTGNLRPETNLLQKIAHHNNAHHPCPSQHQRLLFRIRTLIMFKLKVTPIGIHSIGLQNIRCGNTPWYTCQINANPISTKQYIGGLDTQIVCSISVLVNYWLDLTLAVLIYMTILPLQALITIIWWLYLYRVPRWPSMYSIAKRM